VDAKLEPLTEDERSLAKGHLAVLADMDFGERKPIGICERGYPSKDFVKYLQDKEIKYVMRVAKRFNSRIDKMRSGSKVIKLSEGTTIRAIVFRLGNGERETLITNLEDGDMEDAAFADLYDKRWPIETRYNQVKQKLELENFSGWLADNIKQDFYAMMTVSNMLSRALREANDQIPQETREKRRYDYRANVNHAVGVLKDRLIGILITEDLLTRKYLYRELVSEIRRRIVPIRQNREVPRKEYVRKPHFHHNHKSNC
jgi:cell division protein ZapA (FtsZ GTPase activity inhibitor)